MSLQQSPSSEKHTPRALWKKLAVLAAVCAAAVTIYLLWGEWLSLDKLAAREADLRDFQQRRPLLVYGIAFGVYVVVTGLSLPGAAALTLLYGWYFGLARAAIVVSFASTSGATVAFLLSRFLLRDAIERRFGDRLSGFNRALARDGAFYLFTLRLIPAVPFFAINAVMGLTPIGTWTFWWVSQLGMLPGTAVYAYAGSSVPNLQTLAERGPSAAFAPGQLTQIAIAFTLLGVFPLAMRWLLKRFGRPTPTTGAADSPESEAPR
ncbi:MAG: TVP38/TMEM64 family protein [Planctomycetota bacterium]|nr:MAG: TVP38/TMEM64 family protein [Planctomycetota bacterium]